VKKFRSNKNVEEGYPSKIVILPLLPFTVKTFAAKRKHAAYFTKNW